MLRFSFETEPFEDGMDHPADQIIENALRSAETNASLIGLALSPWMPSTQVSRHRFCVAWGVKRI